jgi:hypothetical protein
LAALARSINIHPVTHKFSEALLLVVDSLPRSADHGAASVDHQGLAGDETSGG